MLYEMQNQCKMMKWGYSKVSHWVQSACCLSNGVIPKSIVGVSSVYMALCFSFYYYVYLLKSQLPN